MRQIGNSKSEILGSAAPQEVAMLAAGDLQTLATIAPNTYRALSSLVFGDSHAVYPAAAKVIEVAQTPPQEPQTPDPQDRVAVAQAAVIAAYNDLLQEA